MLRIPQNPERAKEWARELIDECMESSQERGQIYHKATQYYYNGSGDIKAAIHNKTRGFIDRLAGYYFQPQGVRFNLLFDSNEPADVLERARALGQMLAADYRSTDTDLRFSDAVTWGLVCGNFFLKHWGQGFGWGAAPVHPVNMGVLSESVVNLDEQEAFCHVSYPTITRLRSMLIEAGNPRWRSIIEQIEESRTDRKSVV